METNEAESKRALEALLLVSEKPLLVDQARQLLGAGWQADAVRRILLEMSAQYASERRGIRIVEVAEGFQMVTDPELYPYVARLTQRVRAVRLSRPSLETLAIIAYRQPITRVEIEQVRGVDASGVLDTLLRFNLIRVLGRKEVVGRPLLYGTTREFLDHFGLKGLDDLPTLEEFKSGALQAPATLPAGGPASPTPAAEADETSHDPQPTARPD